MQKKKKTKADPEDRVFSNREGQHELQGRTLEGVFSGKNLDRDVHKDIYRTSNYRHGVQQDQSNFDRNVEFCFVVHFMCMSILNACMSVYHMPS